MDNSQNRTGLIAIGIGVFGTIIWASSKLFRFKTPKTIVPTLQKDKSTPIRKLHKIVGNQTPRGCDSMGCGHYGASRKGRVHQGYDVKTNEMDPVFSPIDGKVVRYAFPYADKSYGGLALMDDAHFIKMFYLVPMVTPGTTVRKGQQIGVAQNIQRRYGNGMTPHIHIEVWDRSQQNVSLDPAKMFV